MDDRSQRLRDAFSALGDGDPRGFRELFAEDAQWLGVAGTGYNGKTPT